ncbi:Unknown protein [Striga hermonthica]|uniref:Uncharacterized protein n=1 Tax=Striga hermonthica TaxID=68872 RepID=A0A9N7RHB7_STRHE|nr:Unknown protein [Striga hermonthica]
MDHCLALRQQLKEVHRARLRKENHHAAVAGVTSQAIAPASANYGRLFGPSEPVIAARVVEEAKHWLLTPKRLNKFFGDEKLFAADTPKEVPKILDKMERTKKSSWLRESRDYSFLSADENSRPIPLEIQRETKNSRPDKERIISPKRPHAEILRKGCEVVLPEPKMKKEVIRRPRIHVRNCSKKEESCEEAIGIIRRMFGYDPAKYKNVDAGTDVNMEANFRDIQKEERRSAKIANKEDAEEFRKIMGNSKKIKRRRD